MGRNFPEGSGSTRVFPAKLVGAPAGGGSNVTAVTQALTPSAATVGITDNKINNGMLKGWSVRDNGSVMDAFADDGSTFDVKIHTATSNGTNEWVKEKDSPDKQGFIYWPNLLMGDFTIEMKFVGSTHASLYSNICLVATQFATDANYEHHSGIRVGSWQTANGKPVAGSVANAGKQVTQAAGTIAFADDNWLILVRSGANMTASYKADGASYTDVIAADAWGIGGGACYVGIGFNTRDTADPATETFGLKVVNLTAFEYTATP